METDGQERIEPKRIDSEVNPTMNTEIKAVLMALDDAANAMRDAGEKMRSVQIDHPEIGQHGDEMLGAASMAEIWMEGISAENRTLS